MKKISLSLLVVCGIMFLAGGARGDFTIPHTIEAEIVVPPAPWNITGGKVYSGSNLDGLKLRWNQINFECPFDADDYYKIYQSTSLTEVGSSIGTVSGDKLFPEFTLETGLEENKTYYFRVSAVDVATDKITKREGPLSEAKKVIYSKAEKISLTVEKPVIVGNGISTSKITARVVDNSGNYVLAPGYEIDFSVVSGHLGLPSTTTVTIDDNGKAEITVTSPLSSWSSGDDPSNTTSLTVTARVFGLETTTTVEILKNVDYSQEQVKFNTVKEAKDFLDKRGIALMRACYPQAEFGKEAEKDQAACDEYQDIVSPNSTKINGYANNIVSIDTWLNCRNDTIPSLKNSFPGLEEKVNALATAISNFTADTSNLQLFDEMVAKAETINDNYDTNSIYNSFNPAYEIVNNLVSQESQILAALSDINPSADITIPAAPARAAAVGLIGEITDAARRLDKLRKIKNIVEDVLGLGAFARNKLNEILDGKILNTKQKTVMGDKEKYNIRTDDYYDATSELTLDHCSFITDPAKEGTKLFEILYPEEKKLKSEQSSLNNKTISGDLAYEFYLTDHTLSADSSVEVKEESMKWVITASSSKYTIITYSKEDKRKIFDIEGSSELRIYEEEKAFGEGKTRVANYGLLDQPQMRKWASGTETMGEWVKNNVGENAWKHLKEWAELASNLPGGGIIKIIIKKLPKEK